MTLLDNYHLKGEYQIALLITMDQEWIFFTKIKLNVSFLDI